MVGDHRAMPIASRDSREPPLAMAAHQSDILEGQRQNPMFLDNVVPGA